MKHILVTGGAGFIGSNIVQHHLEKGDHVWAVDNLQSGQMKNIEAYLNNPLFQFDQADLCTWSALQKAVQWADYIYHMAAVIGQRQVIAKPIETLCNNIKGCERILEAMCSKKSVRLIIASTSGLYIHSEPEADDSYKETAQVGFTSGAYIQESYPVSKLVDEVMCLAYAKEEGLDCTIARLFNTIGVHQSSRYGMVVPTFVEQALNNNPITVHGTGLQTRSFCSVHDTVQLLNSLLDNPKSKSEIVNIGNDKECSINELAKMVKERTQSQSEIVHISYQEAYGIDFIDVQRRKPNLEKMHRLTGYKPKWTLEQTIDETIESLRPKIVVG